ncbi:hypothetical protein GCM10008957_46500 [Deinococcus ruber]|uniref:Uncharacterized protein n=1 Tax=Deinococcus ruber TaxID=1848197 RepID=A0A918CNE4_9DEIO|nr:hypothetical protein GCM10008957_46500 [Deinococcus ruber]
MQVFKALQKRYFERLICNYSFFYELDYSARSLNPGQEGALHGCDLAPPPFKGKLQMKYLDGRR